MVNTAKRRLSSRIQARDSVANIPSHDANSPPASASTSPSSYYFSQHSSNAQDYGHSPASTNSHHRNSTRTTRYNTRSQDTVPETLPTTDQTPPLSSPIMQSTPGISSNQDTPPGEDKNQSVISWILDNYEKKPDSNVPRSGIFEHYQHSCSLRPVKPVNSATFGKLIRMAFPGITTRRLGNRGQSKYQYCNIQRIEPNTPTDRPQHMELPFINPIEPYAEQQQQHQQQRRRKNDVTDSHTGSTGMFINWDSSTDPTASRPTTTTSSENNSSLHANYDTQGFPSYRLPPPVRFTPTSTSPLSLAPRLGDLLTDFSEPNKSYQPTQSSPSPSRLSSSFPTTTTSTSSALDTTTHLTDEFANHYNHHCRDLYNTICAGQFDQIQGIYERFYNEMPSHHRSLLNADKMMDAVWRWDCVLYDSLIVNLLPEVDTPITDRMMSGLLQFARTLPKFLAYLLRDYPATLRQKKSDIAGLFVAKLRRHLTLNQFAVVASDTLRQSDLVENMKADWNKLDIGAILNHVFWICDCGSDDMNQILKQDIPRLLDDGSTLKKWIQWEEGLINKYLPGDPKTLENERADEYLKNVKQFMLKWKVYSGLVMQEFYAMNAFSIDSLKVLQYFLDDLVLYHVEERIANMNANIQPAN